ncbi:MAG: hypothetical protein OXG08_02425 [Gammaproteobacteria bacterium]|nr:hypothetical protein [Gammaproteobacteria bacterium]
MKYCWKNPKTVNAAQVGIQKHDYNIRAVFSTMRPKRGWRLVVALSTILFLLSFGGVLAQPSEVADTDGGQLSIRILGDKILARVEMATQVFFKETHVVIDYASPIGLMINGNVIGGIGYGEGENTLKILNQNFRLAVPRSEIRPEQGNVTGQLTARYDMDLEQVDVIAILGWPVLRRYGMTLDIQDKLIELHPENELVAADVQMSSDVFVEGIEVIGDTVFVPVNYNGGQRAFMKMSTGGYHTVLNRELLDDRERGIVDEAYFGSSKEVKISDMAAFYPQDLYTRWWDEYAAAKEAERAARQQMQEAGQTFPEEFAARQPDQPSSDVLFVSGLSLLAGYRVELDPNQGFVGISRTLNSNYSEADHQFYMAVAAKDEDGLLKYLQENPNDRNVEEAVSDLFALGMESGANVERQLTTVDFGLEIQAEHRKFNYLLGFVGQLMTSEENRDNFADLIIALGEKALVHVSRSESPAIRQQLQMTIGDRYLARNDARNAQRYFLSAAFNGDPRLDAAVRYDLARAYEALGQDRRAFASYKTALSKGLPPSQAENASEALSRIRTRLDPNDELLIDEQEDG